MKRSPRPLRRWPPAPRSPSSSSAPVISEPGMTSPVGWNWTISMSRSGEPRTVGERDPVGGLVGRAGDDLVHGGPAAHRQQRGPRAHAREGPVRMSSTSAPAARARVVEQQLHARGTPPGTVTFARGATCSASRFMISMPVRSPLWIGAVVALAGERLLVDAPLGRAIEEAAVARLQLQHAPRRLRDQRPHQLLVVDEAAALQRVGQVGVERVGRGEDRVVAALDHARAAGAAEQPLHDDGHSSDGRRRRRAGPRRARPRRRRESGCPCRGRRSSPGVPPCSESTRNGSRIQQAGGPDRSPARADRLDTPRKIATMPIGATADPDPDDQVIAE